MRGLLVDVNMEGHMHYLRRRLVALDLWPILEELRLAFATFAESGLAADLDDRSIWERCQADGWVLLTENRNHDAPDSLHAAIRDSWKEGCLPVLTLANKEKLAQSRDYATTVATELADILFDLYGGKHRDQGRIYVPRGSAK